MSILAWTISIVIFLIILMIIIKKLRKDNEDSFLDRTKSRIDDGCAKIKKWIRGC